MRRIAIVCVLVALAQGVAFSEGKAASFDELIAATEGASVERVRDPGALLEPLYSECSSDAREVGELAQRQCEVVRAWHIERLRARRFLATGDGDSITSSPFDGAQKAIPLTITGCIACAVPPAIAGAPRLIVTRPPRGIEDGSFTGIDEGSAELSAPDAVSARKILARRLPRLRVDYVFTAPATFDKGVRVQLLGWRLYDRCSGEVLAAEPPPVVKKLAGDASCPVEGPSEEEVAAARAYAALPETLSHKDLARALSTAAAGVAECASTFDLKGTAIVKLVIHGDGEAYLKLQPPFDTGEANMCLRAALKNVRFPKFKAAEMKAEYPFVLGN